MDRAYDLCKLVALSIPDYCMFVFLPMRKCVSLCQCVPILMVHCVKAILCILCWPFCNCSSSSSLSSISYHCCYHHCIATLSNSAPFLWLGNWPFLVRICFRQPELRISELHQTCSDIELLVTSKNHGAISIMFLVRIFFRQPELRISTSIHAIDVIFWAQI